MPIVNEVTSLTARSLTKQSGGAPDGKETQQQSDDGPKKPQRRDGLQKVLANALRLTNTGHVPDDAPITPRGWLPRVDTQRRPKAGKNITQRDKISSGETKRNGTSHSGIYFESPVVANSPGALSAAPDSPPPSRHAKQSNTACVFNTGTYEISLDEITTLKAPTPGPLRYDAGVSLASLLASDPLDLGYDWRRLDTAEWLELKRVGCDKSRNGDKNSEECAFPWGKLVGCVLAGTEQAVDRECYPLPVASISRGISNNMVDLANIRQRRHRLTLFCSSVLRRKQGGEMHLGDDGLEPPAVVCALNPLDIISQVRPIWLAHMKASPGTRPPLVVTVEADPDTTKPPMNVNDVSPSGSRSPQTQERASLEGFFLRTDLARFVSEASKRLAISSSSTLGEHLSATHNPNILYAEDLALFRHGPAEGYAFMEEPVCTDAVIFSLSTRNPMLRKGARGVRMVAGGGAGWNCAGGARQSDADYAEEEPLESLRERLRLIGDAVVSIHSARERDHDVNEHLSRLQNPGLNDACPVLVLTLPGCLDGRRHPITTIACAVRELRRSHGHRLASLLVACGDEDTARQVDAVINADVHEKSGDLKPHALWLAAAANNVGFHRGPKPLVASLLRELSVNDVWRSSAGLLPRSVSPAPWEKFANRENWFERRISSKGVPVPQAAIEREASRQTQAREIPISQKPPVAQSPVPQANANSLTGTKEWRLHEKQSPKEKRNRREPTTDREKIARRVSLLLKQEAVQMTFAQAEAALEEDLRDLAGKFVGIKENLRSARTGISSALSKVRKGAGDGFTGVEFGSFARASIGNVSVSLSHRSSLG